MSMLNAQTSHRERLDNKIAALIGAIAAALYFFTTGAASVSDKLTAALFVLPLVLSLAAFSLRGWKSVGPAGFVKTYRFYPQKTLRVAITDAVTAYQKNEHQLQWKAWRAKWALIIGAILFVVAVLLKIVEGLWGKFDGMEVSNFSLEQGVSTLIQVVLAVGAIWLAVETRRLRIQDKARTTQAEQQFLEQARRSDEQLSLLQNQVRLSILPPLILGPMPYKEFMDTVARTIKDEGVRQALIETALRLGKEPRFVCLIQNQTDRVAQNVSGVFFDARKQRHYLSPHNIEQLGRGWDALYFIEEPISEPEVIQTLQTQYPRNRLDFAREPISQNQRSYIAILFLDLDGRLYVSRRRFSDAGGKKVAGEVYFEGMG